MKIQAQGFFLILTLGAVLSVSGCDGARNEDATASGDNPAGMPNMPQASSAPEHTAQGTVSSVDQAAGTVSISHGPVASANWPAMTMSFKLADRSAASRLQAGQRVDFRFTIQGGMNATVTQIELVE